MSIDPSWLTAFAIIALPVLGFILGARWMNYRHRVGSSQSDAQATPIGSDTLDVVDSVQAQVEELAELHDPTTTRCHARSDPDRTHLLH